MYVCVCVCVCVCVYGFCVCVCVFVCAFTDREVFSNGPTGLGSLLPPFSTWWRKQTSFRIVSVLQTQADKSQSHFCSALYIVGILWKSAHIYSVTELL